MRSIELKKNTRCVGTVQKLPTSKSISNRVLILDALSGGASRLDNLSEANDTVLMQQLLQTTGKTLNAEDAGTTMRFLTGYLATKPGTHILTGTARMKQRPIGILTRALKQLGAGIRHLEQDGFPPIEITGMSRQRAEAITVRGDVSSQYLSALMMIGPVLPKGLTIKFEGRVTSQPYLEMTASLMKAFGASFILDKRSMRIEPGGYQPTAISVEPDWSAASYWFSFTSLAAEGEILLPRLSMQSLQGDRIASVVMERLGTGTVEKAEGLLLIKRENEPELRWDFGNCPDLAQTVAVACAAKGVRGHFTGLESLRIKETDRLGALEAELGKLGARFREEGTAWVLTPAESLPDSVSIRTYNDHRMAMAFAPLATRMTITLEDPDVVAKSYPRFWDDVAAMGFPVSRD